jgi:hypothetical protein
MYKSVLFVIATSMAAPAAHACVAWANGMSAAGLSTLLGTIAEKVKEENKATLPAINEVLWHSVQTSLGMQGDCGATSVNAKVNVVGEKDGKTCKLWLEIHYVQSSRETPAYYEQTAESLDCLF